LPQSNIIVAQTLVAKQFARSDFSGLRRKIIPGCDLELIEFKQDNARIELHTDKKDTRIVFLDNTGKEKNI